MIDFIKQLIPLWIIPQIMYVIGFLILVLTFKRWVLKK